MAAAKAPEVFVYERKGFTALNQDKFDFRDFLKTQPAIALKGQLSSWARIANAYEELYSIDKNGKGIKTNKAIGFKVDVAGAQIDMVMVKNGNEGEKIKAEDYIGVESFTPKRLSAVIATAALDLLFATVPDAAQKTAMLNVKNALAETVLTKPAPNDAKFRRKMAMYFSYVSGFDFLGATHPVWGHAIATLKFENPYATQTTGLVKGTTTLIEAAFGRLGSKVVNYQGQDINVTDLAQVDPAIMEVAQWVTTEYKDLKPRKGVASVNASLLLEMRKKALPTNQSHFTVD